MNVDQMSTFFALLTVAANVLVLGGLAVYLGSPYNASAERLRVKISSSLGGGALTLAWLVALVATLGSLYFSEVAHYIPCKLCWYQRIAMYPQVVILGIAAIKKDLGVRRYVLPVVGLGSLISIYHYTLQRWPNLSSASCDPTAPCTVTYVWKFHYISIPFMALSGFALIAVILLFGPRGERRDSE